MASPLKLSSKSKWITYHLFCMKLMSLVIFVVYRILHSFYIRATEGRMTVTSSVGSYVGVGTHKNTPKMTKDMSFIQNKW